MPVMIRHNNATELCITKGQEGTVTGWVSGEAPYGRKVIETLFVRLSNPPKPIQFDGLPLNVVSITKLSTLTLQDTICPLQLEVTYSHFGSF
jgi:hypothetical protein